MTLSYDRRQSAGNWPTLGRSNPACDDADSSPVGIDLPCTGGSNAEPEQWCPLQPPPPRVCKADPSTAKSDSRTAYAKLMFVERLDRGHARAMAQWHHPHNVDWARARELSRHPGRSLRSS